MTVISRHHNFENKLTYAELRKNCIALKHEHQKIPLCIPKTKENLEAFNNEDWNTLEKIEASYY